MDVRDRLLQMMGRLDRLLPATLLSLSSEEVTRARLAVLLAAATSVWGPFFALVYLWFGAPKSAVVLFVATVVVTGSIPVLRWTGSLVTAAYQVAGGFAFAVLGLVLATGGNGSPALPWLAAPPILALAIGGWRPGLGFLLAGGCTIAGFGGLELLGVSLDSELSASQIQFLHCVGAFGLSLCLASIVSLYQLEQDRLGRVLQGQVLALENANRAKSLFMANMSHELRTPMNAILGYSELLSEDLQDLGHTELDADVHKVLGAGNHLLSLIDDLLDLSRIEAGGLDLKLGETDLVQVCTTVMNNLTPMATASETRVRAEVPALYVVADRVRLTQILTNLVHNAVKFAGGGEVMLRARRRQDRVVVEVEDDGPGMSEDALGRVFQEFQQAHPSIRATHGGTGLGLTISRRLAEAMGGSLTGESRPGKGCIFRVELLLHTRYTAEPSVV